MENIEEKIEKIKKETADIILEDAVEDLIKDNIVEYEYKGSKYRAVKPTFKQKMLANQQRAKKFIEMIKDPSCVLENDLIKQYGARGISIQEMDDKFNTLRIKREDLQWKLGKALEDGKPREELEIFKKEIENLLTEQTQIVMTKATLLDSSIESQLNVYIFTYLAAMITEKCVDGQWLQAWPDYEALINQHEELVNRVVYYASVVSKSDLPVM